MANFNKGTSGTNKRPVTVNHEGERVYKLGALESIFNIVLGSLYGQETFYEKEKDDYSEYVRLAEFVEQVPEKHKEYVLKIAELARLGEQIKNPVMLLSMAFNDPGFKGDKFLDANGKSKMPYYANQVVLRAKDIVDILAAQWEMHGSSYPKQLRVCLKNRFEAFDEYQLLAGLHRNSRHKLRDCMHVLHPVPKDAKVAALYEAIKTNKARISKHSSGKKKIVTNELQNLGNAKKERDIGKVEKVVQDLSTAAKTANMTNTVKNLVAYARAGFFNDDSVIEAIVNKLTDRKQVLLSGLFPHQLYAAYIEVSALGVLNVTKITDALIDAMDLALDNVANIDGQTAILVDVSGSMRKVISSNSVLRALDVAALLGAIAYKKSNADLFIFGTHCFRLSISRRTPVFEIARKIIDYMMMKYGDRYVGDGTRLDLALTEINNFAKQNKKTYDNVILTSDNDCYSHNSYNNSISFDRYRVGNAEEILTDMISKGTIKDFWINNMLGNDYVVANISKPHINLATGFSVSFIDTINMQTFLGNKPITAIIDHLLDLKKRQIASIKSSKRR